MSTTGDGGNNRARPQRGPRLKQNRQADMKS